MTVYLGIDQSYTGFALLFYDGTDGTTASFVGKHNSKKRGTGVDRLLDIEHWLNTLLMEVENTMGLPGHICMEGYAYSRVNGREQAGELGYAVKRTLRTRYHVPLCYPTVVSTNQLKKFATSKGNADKAQVVKEVYRKWGFDAENDNEADAYTLARIAHVMDNGDGAGIPTIAYEADVVRELKVHTERISA